jgi:hypothetical protein
MGTDFKSYTEKYIKILNHKYNVNEILILEITKDKNYLLANDENVNKYINQKKEKFSGGTLGQHFTFWESFGFIKRTLNKSNAINTFEIDGYHSNELEFENIYKDRLSNSLLSNKVSHLKFLGSTLSMIHAYGMANNLLTNEDIENKIIKIIFNRLIGSIDEKLNKNLDTQTAIKNNKISEEFILNICKLIIESKPKYLNETFINIGYLNSINRTTNETSQQQIFRKMLLTDEKRNNEMHDIMNKINDFELTQACHILDKKYLKSGDKKK